MPHDAASSIRAALTPELLRKRAGAVTYGRGEAYAADGRVVAVEVTMRGLVGIVEGSEPYDVEVVVEDGLTQGTCDCPVGQGGRFCKHQVALALRWTRDPSDEPGRSASRPVSMGELRQYLEGVEQSRLVELLMAQAERDDALLRRLLQMTAAADANVDGRAVRRVIDQAVRTIDHVPYREAWDYVRGIMDAVELIDGVRQAGDPLAAISLAEHALRRVASAIGDVDDSDGGMSEVLARLGEIHLAACEAARPDPVALATTLFEWELDDEWGVFAGAAERYQDVLGDEGLRAYRAAAAAVWARVPRIGPGGRGIGVDADLSIRRIMETLERMSGDVDALIAVMAHDLSFPYEYLRIAEVCAAVGRPDEALDWAERGIADFPGRADGRLRAFLIAEYVRRGRHEDAVGQAWATFAEAPSHPNYQVLRDLVVLGGGDPSAWRDKAVERIRRQVLEYRATHPTAQRARWYFGPTGTVAVQILLDEGDVEAAWDIARELGCGRHEWLDLARRREEAHPDDSVAVYQREAETSIETKRNEGYADGVALMERVQATLERDGRREEWRTYLWDVRARHGRKRNLIKLLDRLR